jgi:hypothetical protein
MPLAIALAAAARPPEDDSVTSCVYRLRLILGTPGCCFPSGGIIIPVIGFYTVWRDCRSLR